jgi:phospholipase/lecithinase/hemolysin
MLHILQQLFSMGARNFAVTGLPPIGCVPLQLTLESFKSSMIPGFPGRRPNDCIQDQNLKVKQMLQELLQQMNSLETTMIVYLDIYNYLLDMSNNPQKYGNWNIFARNE